MTPEKMRNKSFSENVLRSEKFFFLNMTNIFRFGLQHYLNLFLFKLKKNKIITTRRRIRWEWFESVDCRADKKEKKVSSFIQKLNDNNNEELSRDINRYKHNQQFEQLADR